MQCILCAFTVECDDVAISGPYSRCICLSCYSMHTGTKLAMSKELRADLVRTLAGLPA